MLVLGASSAHAWPYYTESLYADPIYDATHCVGVGNHAFSTEDLQNAPYSDPADTFLVVQTDQGAFYNDDCYSGARHSCVIATSTDSCFRVLVFAATPSSNGTADILLDYISKIADDVEFGGTLFPTDPMSPAGWYSVNTVHKHFSGGGASDTKLYLFDASWNLLESDDDGGIRYQAELEGVYLGNPGWILLSSYHSASQGTTSLVINDCVYAYEEDGDYSCHTNGADGDADGLADSLESDIGSDPYDRDTDDDGLYDFFEVVGRDIEPDNQDWTSEEPLPQWGADPLYRDIFLELDERSDWQCDLSENDYQAMRDILMFDMPEVTNPNGFPGIKLHFDTSGSVCSDYTLCGVYGGHSVHDYEKGKQGMSYIAIKGYDDFLPNMRPVRWGLYHYFYLLDGPCSGQTVDNGKMSSYVCDDGPSSCGSFGTRRRILHELGHQFFLYHWGDSGDYDATSVNWKPSYPSMMNYAFSYEADIGYSDGSIDVLDHTNLDENSYSPGQDKSYLTEDPFYLELFSSDAVDWNYDGHQQSGNVRFDIGPQEAVASGHWPFEVDAQQITNGFSLVVPAGGPALVQPSGGPDMYSFALFDDYTPYLQRTMKWSKTSSPNGPWSSAQTLALAFTPDPDGETAAGFINGTYDQYVIIIHPDTSGKLWYAQFDPATDTYIRSDPMPNWPTGVTARQATVTNAGNGIAVVFRDEVSGFLWYRILDELYQWSAWQQLADDDGFLLQSYQTPGLVRAHGQEYLLMSFLDTSGTNDFISFELYNRPSGTSNDFAIVTETESGGAQDLDFRGTGIPTDLDTQVRTRLNLVFIPYYFADGTAFLSGDGYLAAFYTSSGIEWNRLYVRGVLTSYGAEFSDEANRWRSQGHLPDALDTHSLDVEMWGGQARVVFSTNEDGDPGLDPGQYLHYVPHGNGIAATGYTGVVDDTNDQLTIANNMCTVWDIVGNFDYCENSAMPQGVYISSTEPTCEDFPAGP